MKTVVDVWILRSGDYSLSFNDRQEAMKLLANTSFLEQFPDNVMFELFHAYRVTDLEVPGTEYYNDNPDKPLLITKVEVE